MKIVHVTTAHSRYDTRIFLKECVGLANAGFDVNLVVADGADDEMVSGVRIYSVEKARGRITRFLFGPLRAARLCERLDADLYHLHDPELLSIAIRLLNAGKKVIFDAHEDLPKQILTKSYIWPPLRTTISWTARTYERFICRRLTAIVAATPAIGGKFLKINENSIVVNNYPLEGELASDINDTSCSRHSLAYVGGITSIRGIENVVAALGQISTNVRLKLVGPISEQGLHPRLSSMDGWERVDELGVVSRKGVQEILQESFAGVVTFLPAPNHIESQPNKMFEYMSAGIPVIGSNFPLWREIIEGNNCGICVDPQSPKDIALAIDRLAANPEFAKELGENGRLAVAKKYNWAVEIRKLTELYTVLSTND